MLILEKFITFTSMTLKRFIFTATMIVSAVTFAAVIATISWAFLRQAEDLSAKTSNEIAHQILNSAYQAMEDGRDLAGITKTLQNYQHLLVGHVTITIHPGKIINSSSPPLPGNVGKVFSSGTPIHWHTLNTIDYLLPIKAEAKCLGCHPTVRLGEVLGVLAIHEDVSAIRDTFLRKIYLCFFLLLPIPILMSYFVSRFVNYRLGNAVDRLHRNVSSVNSISDLSKLEMGLGCQEQQFSELEKIFDEFRKLISRIKDVAVGKEMLEFEINVLERFIITSEVIRDWKERVGFLLTEINKVMPAYTIFCVFQTDEDIFDIEVFWLSPPSASTENLMEEIVRQRVNQEKYALTPSVAIRLVNNVISPDGSQLELDQHQVEMLTKSIFLEVPQIGGVVGIGVQSQAAVDPIRSLVIDGILTTLLNVVGSIKAMYKYTKDLEYYSTRDPLTNLLNQRVFWDMLGYEVGRAERHSYTFGLLMIDLDNFKHVNDTYGHIIGDKFLSKVAATIHDNLRVGDILARYGGDEFVIIAPEADQEQVCMIANRIREALEIMVVTTADGTRIHGTASIGMAIYPSHAQSPKDLFLFADNMAYKAKTMGRNCIIVPTDEDVVEVFEKTSEMSRALLQALEQKKVIPYFQPIVTTDTKKIVCHEVLCRVELDGKIIPAAEFIELAEKIGILSRLDNILMEKVFKTVQEVGYKGYLFINLSPKSLVLKDFVPTVIGLANNYQIRHEMIVFEITERETIKNMSLLEGFVMDLKLEGFKFAIDDFGSGFSSFQYIRRLPIDFVKIEGMFVRNMLNDHRDMAFVKTLALLAKEFGIQTIAEFVESEELLITACSLGIDFAQGYHTGKPASNLVLPENNPF